MGSKKKITTSQNVSQNGGDTSSSLVSNSSNTLSSDNVPVLPEPTYEPAVNEANPIELGTVETSAERVNPLIGNDLQSQIPIARQNELVKQVNANPGAYLPQPKSTEEHWYNVGGAMLQAIPKSVYKTVGDILKGQENILNSDSKSSSKESDNEDSVASDYLKSVFGVFTDNFSQADATKMLSPVTALKTVSDKIINSNLSQEQKNKAIKELGKAQTSIQGRIDMMDEYAARNPYPSNIATNAAVTIAGMLPDVTLAGLGGGGAAAESALGRALAGATENAPSIVAKYAPKAAALLERAATAPFTKVMVGKGAAEGAAANAENPLLGGVIGMAKGEGEGMYMHVLGEAAGVVSPYIAKLIGKTGASSEISTAISNPLANAGVFTTAKSIRTPLEEGRMATPEELESEVGLGIGFSLLHAGQNYKTQKEANHFYENTLKTDPQESLGRVLNEKPENILRDYNPDINVKDLTEARDELKKAIIREPDMSVKKQLGDEALKIQNQLDAKEAVEGIVQDKNAISEVVAKLPELTPEQKEQYVARVNEIANEFSPVENLKRDLSSQIIQAETHVQQLAEMAKNPELSPAEKIELELKGKQADEVVKSLNSDLTKVIDEQLNPTQVKEYKITEQVTEPKENTLEPINKVRIDSDKVAKRILHKGIKEGDYRPVENYEKYFGDKDIYRIAKESGLKIVELTDEMKKDNPMLDGSAGKYIYDNTVTIDPKYLGKDDNGRNVLQHEAAHAFTVSVLLEKDTSKLNPTELNFKNEIAKAFKENKTSVLAPYGLKNELEFVAEFYGNDKFRKYLKNENLPLWQKILKLISGVLKIDNSKLEGIFGDFKKSFIEQQKKEVKNETNEQPLLESKNDEALPVSSAEETVAKTGEEILKKEHALKEIEKGVLNWDGDRFSPRVSLGIEWTDIRKGREDLLSGKNTVASKRLIEALDKAKSDGGYDYVQGSGKITSRQFIQLDAKAPEFTKEETEYISNNEKGLSEEYDNWFEKLTPEEKSEELKSIQDGEKYFDTSAKSEENVSNKEDTEIERETSTEKGKRGLAEIESDQKTLMARYQDALKAAGLYELAKEGKAPEKELNDIKVQFSKEAEALKVEKSALNETPIEDKKPEQLSAADKIRKMKVGKSKAFESILGIPIAIYDGALETVATAIEAGKSIKDAIKAAVAYFKDKSEVKDEVAIEKELRRVLEEGGLLIKGTDEANPTPEVISEIEDSPEFIADENIAEFKKRLGNVLDNAKAQTIVKTGDAKASLAMNAIKLVSEIKDRKSMLDAARAVKKLFNNVVDNTYRSQIEQAKKGLKNRIKSSALAKVEVIKKFIGIDEKTLNTKELEEYNELVRQLNEQYNTKIEGVIADSDLQKFVDKVADRKAKEIEQEQLGEVAEEETDTEKSKADEKSGRRKQLEAVVAINRKELQKGGYSDKYKVVAQALNRMDVSNLSNADMVKLNLALINLSVNDRLVGHEKVFKDYIGQQGLERVLPLESKVKGILESELAAATRSFDVNSKIIFKGIKDATEFQTETGIAGISNANSQVKNIDMKTIDRDYQALIKNMKFPDYNTADNRFLRALYSNSTQFSSIEGQGKDFNRYKSLIKQSAEKLVSSNNIIEQREGKLRMDQYQEYLEPYENRQDFEDAFKKAQPQNVKIVDFFRNKFNDKYGELKTNSQIYAGKNLKDENNYLPIKYKRYSGTEIEQEKELNDIVDPVYEFDPETGDISERQSSTTIERKNVTKIKDTDRIMDMDFDRYIFDKYREMNYDIRTLKFRHQYNAIRSQEQFRNVVGGPENSNILTKGVRNMVKRQMGGTFDNNVLNNAVRATRVVTGKAVRQALFGVLQPLKQYPSVAIRTAINLNTDLGLLFKGIAIGKDNPIFDNFGVGLRSTTKGGTQTETELGRIYKSDFSSTPAKLAHAINRIGQKTADMLSKPLTFSDDAIAKHSWLAYYMKHIRDNGGDINKIDWDNEHINPDQKAGAYADLMISTTQNTNDNAKQADLLAERKYAIGRDLIAPFVSFARNSQANLEADLRTFSGGTASEKRSAAAGILSTVAEQAAFNTIKALIATYLVKQGADFMRHLFGDDEEGSEPKEGMGTKILKNTTSDVLFSGMGSMANYWAIKGLNQANKVVTGADKDLFYQYDPGKYGEPDFSAAGLFGTLPQSIYNASQKADYLDGNLSDTYTNKGKEFKASVELDPQDRAIVSTLFFLDALSIAGLSDAEISRINQTMFRDIKKRTAPVKRFQVEGANKKAGAMKERL